MSLPRTLALSIDRVARQAVGKDWSLYAALLDHWSEIVGEDYARSTTPVKISFPKGKAEGEKWAGGKRAGGLLHIRLPQGLAMEFSFSTDQVRQRINSYFGYEAISRLAFEPYYAETAPFEVPSRPSLSPPVREELQKSLEPIENEDLRVALEAFGERVLEQG
ncbi:MAG: DUF721 domain-containing protein [Alphaproteobacteria bacterium]|nr:DUF721 domain-containing protein [Alphaproteobacteria bacterium]